MDVYEYWLEHTREMVELIFGPSEDSRITEQRERDWYEYLWNTL